MARRKFISVGMSLIEMLLALVIGLLLLASLYQLFFRQSQAVLMYQSIAAIKMDKQIIKDMLKQEIHLAGYVGCQTISHNHLINDTTYLFNRANFIETSSHSLTVRHASSEYSQVMQPMHSQFKIVVNAGLSFKKGNIVIIENCQNAEMFEIEKVEKLNHFLIIYSQRSLKNYFSENASVHFYRETKFYSEENTHAGRMSLLKKSIGAKKTELAQNVTFSGAEFYPSSDNPLGMLVKLDEIQGNILINDQFYVGLKNK